MRTVETISHYTAGLVRKNLIDARAMAIVFDSAGIRPNAIMMPGMKFLCDAIACTQTNMESLQDIANSIRQTDWYLQDKPDIDIMAREAIGQARAIWDAYRMDYPRDMDQTRTLIEKYLRCMLQNMIASVRFESRDVRNTMLNAISQLRDEGLAPPACAIDMPLARHGIVRLDAFAPVTPDAAKAAMADYFNKQARAVMGLE